MRLLLGCGDNRCERHSGDTECVFRRTFRFADPSITPWAIRSTVDGKAWRFRANLSVTLDLLKHVTISFWCLPFMFRLRLRSERLRHQRGGLPAPADVAVRWLTSLSTCGRTVARAHNRTKPRDCVVRRLSEDSCLVRLSRSQWLER